MSNNNWNTPFGPFENPDDISKYWYQVEEKELEKYKEEAKKDFEDPSNSKEDKEIYEKDFNNWSQELETLQNFVDKYTRCIARYKFDKQILQQIQNDWQDYNLSLYTGFCRQQQMSLDTDMTRGEGLKAVRAEAKAEKIKREEIERRIRNLLSK